MVTKKNYVKNSELQSAIELSHKNVSPENLDGQLTNGCVKMFDKMIKHLSWGLPYRDKELKRDVQAYAMFVCAKNWRKYDITRNSAFSFFTSTILNGLRAGFHEYSKGDIGDIHIQINQLIKLHDEKD